jgi:hypothetical protein
MVLDASADHTKETWIWVPARINHGCFVNRKLIPNCKRFVLRRRGGNLDALNTRSHNRTSAGRSAWKKVAAEGRCGAGRVGLQSLSATNGPYQEPRKETTLAASAGALERKSAHAVISRRRFSNRSPRR